MFAKILRRIIFSLTLTVIFIGNPVLANAVYNSGDTDGYRQIANRGNATVYRDQFDNQQYYNNYKRYRQLHKRQRQREGGYQRNNGYNNSYQFTRSCRSVGEVINMIRSQGGRVVSIKRVSGGYRVTVQYPNGIVRVTFVRC